MDRPGSHSQKVPYARKEGRKSLFSKVKDSMRDMLSPSWLSDIVTSVKKESPPKVTQDNATAAPPFSGGVPQQSMVPNAPGVVVTPQTFAPYPGQSLVNGQPRTLDFSNQSPALVPSPYQTGAFLPPVSEFTSAQLPLNRLAEKTDSVMAQEDTMSQRSDSSKSTSGCSSMIPQTDPGPSREKRKASVDTTIQVSISGNQTFSRRLGDTFVQRNSASAGSRPAFNTSLFASPLQNDTSLLGTSFHESSFYPGKTVYGGRSSMSFSNRKKKVDLNQSLPGRLSVPVKAFMKAKPRVNSNKEAVTSSTAKRILEALDRMPTPVNDAKRIPVMPGSWTESASFSRDSRRVISRSGPPTQNLNISTQASISRNRQVSFTPQTRPSTGTEMMPANKPASPQAQGGFKFSSPISVDKQQQQLVSSTKHTPFSQSAVNFSTPPSMAYDFTAKAKPKPKANGPTSFDAGSGGHLVASELKQGSVMDILGGGGFSKPKESPSSSINGGSVSQASSSKGGMLFGKSTAGASAPPLSAMFKSSGWQCEVCLVDNKQESEKCIACQTSKPASKTPASNVQDSSGDLMAKFQTPSGQWSCDTCLLQNKPDLDKCIACQTPKPAAKSQISKVSDNGSDLLAKFKTPSGQWTCDVCMVQNKPELDKCVCCQTPNPVPSCANSFTTAQSGKIEVMPTGGFSFKSTSSESAKSGFSFNTTTSESKSNDLSGSTGGFKFDSGSSSTNSSTSAGFKFGSDTVTKASENSSSTGGFKFGGENKTSNNAGGFKFGDSDVKTGDKKEQDVSAQKVGGFSFTQPSESSQNSVSSSQSSSTPLGGFTFGSKPEGNMGSSQTSSLSAVGFGLKSTDSNTGETASKKSFSFGQATNGPTSTPFQLNAAAANTGASSVPGSLVFGQKPTESTANSGLFAFGAGKSSAPSSSITPSVFGSALQASSASTVTPVFGSETSASATTMSSVFGQAAASSTASGVFGQPASGMTSSVFGQAASTTSSVFGQSSGLAASTGTPVFGQTAASTTAAASTTTAVAPTFNTGPPSFNFGQKPDTSTTSAPVFKFGAAPESQPSATTTHFTGAFGTSNNTGSTGIGSAFGGNTLSTTPSFGATPPVFGTNAAPTATPSFGGFGGSQPVAPASGVFQFGAKPTESSSAPAQPGYNFAAPGGGTNFNFQNQSGQAANPFSAGSSGTPTTEGRKIKKATRRIKR
ncbi:NU153-like protein [Mya arenaria]|uniref:Nuclear pore complex protein Nup153 n=1 Tax=Mya arenaria TaxID=6604 RepID=A0ABY7FPE6_MYAAR|nr:NU153-like protein [Mya arenaria]